MRAPTWYVIGRGRRGRAAVPAAAALILLAAAAPAQQPLPATPFTQPEFVEADCPMSYGQARGAHLDCGYVTVLEDRARPDGNVIRLAVARLRGSVPSPRPDPVIYLAGGPGESALQKAHRIPDQPFIADTRFIWEERDLILLDQRGIGHSQPRLECPDYDRRRAELPAIGLDPDEVQREVDALLACKHTLSEQGIDMSAYTPEAISADVVDLAAAMGYEAYNLYGSSFGTLLALTVMRDYPDHVRGVVLDGVWPPQVNAAEARHANAAFALEALFRRCEADPECSRRYPGLEQEVWQVVDRYEARPTITWDSDPDSSEPVEVEVDGHFILRRVVESLRSDSWIPYLPFLVHRIAGGDHEVADAFIRPRTWRTSIDNSAAWVSLLCHAEGSFADLSGVLADRAAYPRFADPETADLVPALCAAWHDPTTEPVDRAPVASAVPTLLLSGEFDPSTPPRWVDLAAETLSRSHSFVVPMGGHGVGLDTRCGRALVGAFLNAPGADPSPACSPAEDQKRSGFRTIYLNRLEHVPVSLKWYDYAALKVLMALGVLLIVALQVSALILWPVAAIVRRVGSGAELAARGAGHPRLTAAAVIAVSAGFSWSVGAAVEVLYAFWALAPSQPVPWPVLSFFSAERTWMTDEVVRNFGYYPWVRPLFVIPYLTAAATVYVLYLALRSWREKWWTGLGRVHYSIVAITLAWYPFLLVSSGIIP